jgi:hypothetical protein
LIIKRYGFLKEQFFSGEIKSAVNVCDLMVGFEIRRVSKQKSKGVFIFSFLFKKTGSSTGTVRVSCCAGGL